MPEKGNAWRAKNGKMIELGGQMKTIGKNAFTLAEVLITLAIIGVVAALTIPNILSPCLQFSTLTTGRAL